MPARIVILLSVLCLVGNGCAKFHPSHPKGAFPPGVSPAHGKTIFVAQCVACHGAEGRGGPIGPGLRGERVRKTAQAIREAIEFPTPPMPKLFPGQLSRRDLVDVTAYVEQL